jgi:hypothetical protein
MGSVHIYCQGLRKVTEPHLDGGEKIKLLPVTFEEFKKMMIRGEGRFDEDIALKFLRAELDPEKQKELEGLFQP